MKQRHEEHEGGHNTSHMYSHVMHTHANKHNQPHRQRHGETEQDTRMTHAMHDASRTTRRQDTQDTKARHQDATTQRHDTTTRHENTSKPTIGTHETKAQHHHTKQRTSTNPIRMNKTMHIRPFTPDTTLRDITRCERDRSFEDGKVSMTVGVSKRDEDTMVQKIPSPYPRVARGQGWRGCESREFPI